MGAANAGAPSMSERQKYMSSALPCPLLGGRNSPASVRGREARRARRRPPAGEEFCEKNIFGLSPPLVNLKSDVLGRTGQLSIVPSSEILIIIPEEVSLMTPTTEGKSSLCHPSSRRYRFSGRKIVRSKLMIRLLSRDDRVLDDSVAHLFGYSNIFHHVLFPADPDLSKTPCPKTKAIDWTPDILDNDPSLIYALRKSRFPLRISNRIQVSCIEE